jgi:Wadjet protein JetD, C-terminal
VPRMLTRVVGDGDLVLIVENSDTFDSVVTTLRKRPGCVGVVGWGAGTGFEASILSLEDLDRPVSAIRYFGDLDRVGLRIPASASELAVTSGLPPVLPAVELYDALLEVGRPQPGQPRLTEPAARHLVRWLDPIHRGRVRHLLDAGERLAQEAVGLRYLLGHDNWQPR